MPAVRVLVAGGALVAAAAYAAEGELPAASPVSGTPWAFAITGYPTVIRAGDSYTSAVAAADRGPLHLEVRLNYESVGARSAFVGWTFSGGDALTWELTPLLGGVWGATRGVVPGFEASLAWGRVDLYVEAEFVRDSADHAGSYAYAWSELGYRPSDWLRVGVAGQRSRAYGGDRDLQRGPFVQVTAGSFTLGGYWFNPGSSEQIFVASIGVTF